QISHAVDPGGRWSKAPPLELINECTKEFGGFCGLGFRSDRIRCSRCLNGIIEAAAARGAEPVGARLHWTLAMRADSDHTACFTSEVVSGKRGSRQSPTPRRVKASRPFPPPECTCQGYDAPLSVPIPDQVPVDA